MSSVKIVKRETEYQRLEETKSEHDERETDLKEQYSSCAHSHS